MLYRAIVSLPVGSSDVDCLFTARDDSCFIVCNTEQQGKWPVCPLIDYKYSNFVHEILINIMQIEERNEEVQ